MMIVLWLFMISALLIIALTALLNVLTFPRLKNRRMQRNAPRVSVLIPARNEAAVIGQTIENLLAQDYPSVEYILVDDHSDDGTAAVGRAAAKNDPRLTILQGKPLPQGWSGKNWACHQLSQAAHGEILIFTDADVCWKPDALMALTTMMENSDSDLLTVWPTQETKTWAERLVVPLIAFAILGYLPALMVHHTPFSAFAAANGQCMAWRRRAYDRVGGHQGVADNVLEDVTMARLAKSKGLRLRMTDAAGLITCRMYQDWHSVRDGFAKNILAGYGGSVFALGLGIIFHLLLFIVPWIMLLDTQWRSWAWGCIALGIGVRALSAAATRQRIQDAVWMPFSVLLMSRIALQSIWWHYTGGPRWKGRAIGMAPSDRSSQRRQAHG